MNGMVISITEIVVMFQIMNHYIYAFHSCIMTRLSPVIRAQEPRIRYYVEAISGQECSAMFVATSETVSFTAHVRPLGT